MHLGAKPIDRILECGLTSVSLHEDMEGDVRKETLPAEQIRGLFDYESATGLLIWRFAPTNSRPAGSVAGAVRPDGCRWINIDGKSYPAHRLVWVHQKGVWPTAHIRQKDADLSNARIENLYESSRSATNASRGIGSNNTSGVIGVGFNQPRQKWKAWIKRDSVLYHLGYFENFDEAVAVRAAAEAQFIAGAPTEQIKAAGHAAAVERRQRVAWNQVNADFEGEIAWSSFEDFTRDIGDALLPDHRLLRISDERPIGPQNFRWFIPPSQRFEAETDEGRKQIRREYRRRNPRIVRGHDRKKLYGLTPEQFAAKVAKQLGLCAICGGPQNFTSRGLPRALDVDHDHKTGVIRDLLCTNCNTGIGKLDDSPERLRAAADYIERHRANVIPLPRKDPAA